MSHPAPGGGTGAITLDSIRNVVPSQLRTAATALTNGSGKLDASHGDFTGRVQNPLLAGIAWTGVGQPQAGAKAQHHASQVTGVSQRLSPAATVLNGLANYLDSAKRQLHNIDASAQHLHVTVSSTGDITVNDIQGESPDDGKTRANEAGQLLGQVQAVLRATAKVDGRAAATLGGLQQGDPTTPPPPGVFDASYWKQDFSDPTFWAQQLANALAVIPGALRSGALKFSAAALSQHDLAKSLSNPAIRDAARKAAAKGFGTAFDMEYTLARLGKAGELATKGFSKAGPILKDMPYIGWALTGVGIGIDRANGESWGQAVTSNVLPTVAGTAATEGTLAILASTAIAGGPATLIAVGAGVGVAYGVSYVVDHWYGISHGIEEGASWVGDKVGDAAAAVGDFFGSIF